jgi:hypothetical protein
VAVQALGKLTVLQLHEYEAETTQFITGFSSAIGSAVTVESGDNGDGETRGLLAPAASGELVYGIITKLPADNNGKLRYQRTNPHLLA